MNTKKIKTFLWFDGQAEEAARLYTSIFKDSKIGSIARYPEGSPGPTGKVMTVEFQLNGQDFVGLNGGPQFTFNESVSFAIPCDTQEEIDYYWDRLLAGGGQPQQCGWLKDKFGVSWQVVPSMLGEFFSTGDKAKAERAMQVMLEMVKLDIAKLEAAAGVKGDVRVKITVDRAVKADLNTVWAAWNHPEDIKRWNAASDDWHTPRSSVDLREGGKFCARMEARDGSEGFDFEGTYTRIVPRRLIEYRMDDGRNVSVEFSEEAGRVLVRETFDAESENPPDLQRQGWQAILDNFARHVEAKSRR